uniref:Uncharacterized protein n=1 Tax=Yamadaella caenomyce TaxID=259029 RepID=A0A1G4NYJ5_9FLOR|nr:Hypothetical protein ycf37 [Yamadaella caenomyce]SCW23728.1 Hypothetical protein ycf37 [Yamadaella caenomyce]
MATLYLITLIIILSPITISLTFQVVRNFWTFKQIKNTVTKNNRYILNATNEFNIGKLYIDQKQWSKAITILDNCLYFSKIESKSPYLAAKHYNAIGFILETNQHRSIARRYYEQAFRLSPEYNIARKNFDRIRK